MSGKPHSCTGLLWVGRMFCLVVVCVLGGVGVVGGRLGVWVGLVWLGTCQPALPLPTPTPTFLLLQTTDPR